MTEYGGVIVLVIAQLEEIKSWVAAGKRLSHYHRQRDLPCSYQQFVRIVKRYLGEKPDAKPKAQNPTTAASNPTNKPEQKSKEDPNEIKQFKYSAKAKLDDLI